MNKFYEIVYKTTQICHSFVVAENEDEAIQKYHNCPGEVYYEGPIKTESNEILEVRTTD